MIGAKVIHKAFGEGTVTGRTDGYVKVRFAAGEKEFPFPQAFDGFLRTEDSALLEELERLREAARKEQARREEETRKAEEARRAEQARQEELARIAAERKLAASGTEKVARNYKPEGSNLAFKCNRCDGGRSEDCVGFRGVCSDQMIFYNIGRAQHVWCGGNSRCRQYYDRKITRKQLDEESDFICYEARMLLDWKCQAGSVETGIDSGKLKTLRNVREGSLAVMTTRDPDTADYSRYIFGVFLIDEYFEGDQEECGYVAGHSKWRIELKPDEARQVLFWNYYVNKNAPEKMVFGSGLFRYLSDVKAAQILRDIVRVKQDAEEKAFAEEFYNHFCGLTGIDGDSLPEPRGALRL